MKQLQELLVKFFIIMSMIIVMGMFIPMVITTIVVIFTPTTFAYIIGESVIFWIFTIIGCIVSACYISSKLNE